MLGLLLTSMLLARESKSLLIGERAERGLGEAILRIATAEPGVQGANGVITMQMAPDQIVAALSVDFADAMSARDVENVIVDIERKVRAERPDVVTLFVKPQSRDAYEAAVTRLYGSGK